VSDRAHQRREWVAERIGWGIMALLIVAALLGVLGPGPVSGAVAGSPGGPLWIEYNRFERHQARSTLRIHVGPGTGDPVRLTVGREFSDQVDIRRINPEPVSTEAAPDRLVYTFERRDPSQPATVIYAFEHSTMGRMHIRIGLDRGGPAAQLEFSQYVYP
jgi:hypothetical protein